MDLTENCEDLAFRQEVRRFVRERLPAALREKAFRLRKPDKEELVAWHRLLQAQGWGAPAWSMRTSARRAGDKYFVTGQKIWTSTAPWADWMFALVRTSAEGRPNQGISFLLIDMRSPGVQTQWITGIDGSGTLAQVFLDEVEVPVENLVHRENEGWTVAKYLLGFERTGQASIGHCKFLLHLLERLAARERVGGGTAAADPAFGQRIADARIELMAHEWTLLRVLGSEPQQPYVFSMLKNRGAEIQQLLIALMLECAGPGAPASASASAPGDPLPDADDIAAAYLDLRKLSIFAGTTEVQKNIIAKALLS